MFLMESTNSSYTSVACSVGVNSGNIQCCGKRSYNADVQYPFVAGQYKHRLR